jgi:protein TonB
VAGTPQPIRAGGNVQRLHLIRKASPAYPADAQAERVEGTVLLRAVVSKEGSMLHVTPISDVDQRRVSAAIAAISLWRYEPTLLTNEPVEAITTIAVNFRLN